MKTPLVSLRRVSVSYDGHDALKEVDLDIYPDDFLGIIGPCLLYTSPSPRD